MEKYSKEFLMLMHKLTKLMKLHQPKMSVHPGEFTMLATIHECIRKQRKTGKKEGNGFKSSVRISDISSEVHSTKPAVSKMINSLEQKGHVIRVPNSQDRREIYVELTESGEAILREHFKLMYHFTDLTLERIGEEDTKNLILLMNKFYEAMGVVLEEINSEK